MKGETEISVYYTEVVRVKVGQGEKMMKRETRVPAKFDSLDQLQRLVKEAAQTQARLSGKGVLAQTFVWTDDTKGSVHVAFEIPAEERTDGK